MANTKGTSVEDLPPYQLQCLLDIVSQEFGMLSLLNSAAFVTYCRAYVQSYPIRQCKYCVHKLQVRCFYY